MFKKLLCKGTKIYFSDVNSLKEENSRLKEQNTCRICMDKMSDIIFLPCGHIVSCAFCAPALKKCPVCRKGIQGIVKAMFATIADCVSNN